MNKTELAQKRLNAISQADEYYIHECYHGHKTCCEAVYKVTYVDYLNWEKLFPYDCFDETTRKHFQGGCSTHYTTEHHLYLDADDCDDPTDVVTMHYDWSL